MLRLVGSLAACVSLGIALAGCGGSSDGRAGADTLSVLDRSIFNRRSCAEGKTRRCRALRRSWIRPTRAGSEASRAALSPRDRSLLERVGSGVRLAERNRTLAFPRAGQLPADSFLSHSNPPRSAGRLNGSRTPRDQRHELWKHRQHLRQHGGASTISGTFFKLSGPAGMVVSIAVALSD